MTNHLTSRALLVAILVAGIGDFGTVNAQEQSDAGERDGADLVEQGRQLLDSINVARTRIDEFRQKAEAARGEERLLFERRRLDKSLEALSELGDFVANVLEQEEQGLNASEFREAAEGLVTRIAPLARQLIEELQAEISELGGRREETTGEDQFRLETVVAKDNERLNLILEAALNNAQYMKALGLQAGPEESYLAEVLTDRAEISVARIQLSLEQIVPIQGRLSDSPDNAELKAELSAAEFKRAWSTATLSTTIDLMQQLELETNYYQQLMIQLTGQVTTDVLDVEVLLSLFGRWLARLKEWAVESGPSLFFRTLVLVLILLFFHLLARATSRVVGEALASSNLKFSLLLQRMFVSTAGISVRIIGLLVALSQFGFALGPVLAGLGIAGFIVGFALQDTLGNFAAGIMILLYQPFDVEDMVEVAGVHGLVKGMNMVSTTILTIDHQTLVVPNGKIWSDVIKNITAQKIRRVDMVFGISYADDILHTEKVLADIVKENSKILNDPEPVIRLHSLGESSVDFVVRPWCETEDYWDVYWDVTREVKLRFDREAISIPFPQRDVHLYEEKRERNAG